MTFRILKAGMLATVAMLLAACSSTSSGSEGSATAEDDLMAAMVAAAAPGEHHALLAKMTGSWDVATLWWADGDAEPVPGEAEARHTMVMGGRFLQMEFEGLDEEMPFEGFGILGYDNATRCYQSTWNDSSSTVILFQQSEPGPTGPTIATWGTHVDLVKGHTIEARNVWTVKHDGLAFEMYESHKGAAEYRSLKIVYTKK